MPTTEEEQPNKSILLAVQALFYKVGGSLTKVLCFRGSLHAINADSSVPQKTARASSLESSQHCAQHVRHCKLQSVSGPVFLQLVAL